MTMTADPFAKLQGTGLFREGADEAQAAEQSKPQQRTPDDRRPNKYAGQCVLCGSMVAVGSGFIVKVGQSWKAEHKPGDCVAIQQQIPGTEEPKAVEPTTDVNFPIWTGRYSFDTAEGHRTFQVEVQASDADFAPGEVIINFLSGPDHHEAGDWTSFGFVKPGPRVVMWKRFRDNAVLARDVERFVAAWKKHFTDDPKVFFDAMEADGVYATRRCARCGEDLTVPQSVRQGMGPTCIKKGLH